MTGRKLTPDQMNVLKVMDRGHSLVYCRYVSSNAYNLTDHKGVQTRVSPKTVECLEEMGYIEEWETSEAFINYSLTEKAAEVL